MLRGRGPIGYLLCCVWPLAFNPTSNAPHPPNSPHAPLWAYGHNVRKYFFSKGDTMAGRPGIHGGRAPKPSDQAETKRNRRRNPGRRELNNALREKVQGNRQIYQGRKEEEKGQAEKVDPERANPEDKPPGLYRPEEETEKKAKRRTRKRVLILDL